VARTFQIDRHLHFCEKEPRRNRRSISPPGFIRDFSTGITYRFFQPRLLGFADNKRASLALFRAPPLLLFVIFFTDVLLFLANLHNFFKSASHDPASEIIRGFNVFLEIELERIKLGLRFFKKG
jgi:hypothetical protein